MEFALGILAGLTTSILAWLIVLLLLRPRIHPSSRVRVASSYGRDARAMIRIKNVGPATLTDVSVVCYVLTGAKGSPRIIQLGTTAPFMDMIAAWRPRYIRQPRPLGTYHRVVSLEMPSQGDSRLHDFVQTSQPPTTQLEPSAALANALLSRSDYQLIVVGSATDSLSGKRGVAFVRYYQPSDVVSTLVLPSA